MDALMSRLGHAYSDIIFPSRKAVHSAILNGGTMSSNDFTLDVWSGDTMYVFAMLAHVCAWSKKVKEQAVVMRLRFEDTAYDTSGPHVVGLGRVEHADV